MSAVFTQTLRNTALDFHNWGANVLNIKRGEKWPMGKSWGQWKDKRQTSDDVTRFRWDYAGGVGVVAGINNWRFIDIDANEDDEENKIPVPAIVVDLLLDALGLPEDYSWTWRSGSGAGWGIAVICDDDILHESLKLKSNWWFEPNEEGAGDFAHIEIRWKDCQSILPPSTHPSGGKYIWKHEPPTTAPSAVSAAALYEAVTVTGDTHPRPAALAKSPASSPAPTTDSAERKPKKEDTPLIAEIRRKFDMVAYAKKKLATTEESRPNGEIELNGQGGLIVTPDKSAWYSFRDEVGGDCFDLVGWLDFGGSWFEKREGRFENKSANWAAVLSKTADFAGVDIPTPSFDADTTPPPIDYDFVVKCLNNDERGDADLLAYIANGRAVYDVAEKEFFLFDGQRFAGGGAATLRLIISGVLPRVYLTASKQARHQQNELQKQIDAFKAKDETPPDELKESMKEYKKIAERLVWRARALRKRKGVNNTLFFFESLTAKNGDFWDCDNDLLAVENGVVDLRTGKLRNGRPTDYMRLYAPTEWRGVDEPAPRWERFISEIMGDDEETGAYLLRLLGYAISGHTIEHKLPFFIGDEGSNGKSKLFNALRSVLGDSNSGYVRMLNKEVILKSRANDGGASPHIHMMRGARLGLLSETSEGERLDLGQMKQITGGDAITSRKLYGDPVTWENHCQLLMVTNHLPHGDADDSASWRRLTVIPFEQKFVENPTPNTNERKMDKRLDEVLRAEASGILGALVRAGIEWRATGLQPSKAARARVRAYRMQEDTLQTFIDDCLVISGDDSFIEARDIYKTYANWSKEGGMKAMSSNAFGRKFGKRFERQRPSGVTVYLGVKLKALGRDILAAAEAGKGGGMVTTAEDDEQTNVSFPPTSLSSPVNTTVGESKPIVAISSPAIDYSQLQDDDEPFDDIPHNAPPPPPNMDFLPPIVDGY